MFVGIGVGIGRNRFAQGIFNAYNLRVVADGGITEAGACVNAVSSLLQSASLLIIPSGYKSGKAYAEIPTNGNGDLTWTRASDAWRTNADGLIQRVPWNLLQYSEEFSNVNWTKLNSSTITANTTNAPNGTLTADTYQASNLAFGGICRGSAAITIISGQTYTFSFFAKKNNYRYVGIRFNTSINVQRFPNYDFDTDTLNKQGVTCDLTRILLSDGWVRIVLTYTTTSTAGTCDIGLTTSNGDTATALAGTEKVDIWGAQLVEGSSAQTYFPTTDRVNVPRLSYMYGSCPALLLEPQRTNLALYSEQFDNASWLKGNTTATANSTTSPDGTTNADTITIQTTSGNNLRQNITVTANTTYTFSFYALRGTATDLRYSVFNFSGGSDIVAVTSYYSQTNSTTWSRITVTFTTPTGCTSIGVYPVRDATSTGTFFIWGAQLELGAYATTIIPTTTASATRIADTASKTGISSLIGQSEGTVFLDIYFSQLSNAGFRAFFSLEGSTTNQFSGINPQTTNNGNDISYAGTNYTLTTGRHKIICTYSQTNNQRKLFVDGVLRATSTHTNFSATIDRYSVGCRINPFSAFDLDRQLSSDSGVFDYALFNSLLTDTQCQTLTTL